MPNRKKPAELKKTHNLKIRLDDIQYNNIQELAKEANAVYHVKRIVLVNTEVIDAYLENFKD